MDTNTVWYKRGSAWIQRNNSSEIPSLSNKVYRLAFSKEIGFYLEEMFEEFTFPHKIYDTETGLINRTIRTYHNIEGNLGLLFNGIKGTGKTVTAKLLANGLKQPIILINEGFPGPFADFLASIEQDVTLFFDEFEKVFTKSTSDEETGYAHGSQHPLLSLMDGALRNKHRRAFILTTNKRYLDDSFLSRPGRIRYIKEFGDLDADAVREILEDVLNDKSFLPSCTKYISSMKIITVDIVKSLGEEVNIHGEDPDEFRKIFNVEERDQQYNVYKKYDDKEEWSLFAKRVECIDFPFEENQYSFRIPGHTSDLVIQEVIAEDTVQVNEGFGDKMKKAFYRVEKVNSKHPSYYYIEQFVL